VHGAARFMLNVLCPPDPADDNHRLMPPIGHHPHARRRPGVGLAGTFIKDDAPELPRSEIRVARGGIARRQLAHHFGRAPIRGRAITVS